MMRRREFIAGLGALTAAHRGARAQQQTRTRRIAALMVGSPNEPRDYVLIATLQRTLESLKLGVGRGQKSCDRCALGWRRHCAHEGECVSSGCIPTGRNRGCAAVSVTTPFPASVARRQDTGRLCRPGRQRAGLGLSLHARRPTRRRTARSASLTFSSPPLSPMCSAYTSLSRRTQPKRWSTPATKSLPLVTRDRAVGFRRTVCRFRSGSGDVARRLSKGYFRPGFPARAQYLFSKIYHLRRKVTLSLHHINSTQRCIQVHSGLVTADCQSFDADRNTRRFARRGRGERCEKKLAVSVKGGGYVRSAGVILCVVQMSSEGNTLH
jgi:hypothetical protein